MTNQQLFDYIQKEKEQGRTEDEIKSKLLESGWGKEDVNRALGIEESVPPPPPSSFVEAEMKNLHPRAFWLFFLKKTFGLIFILLYLVVQLLSIDVVEGAGGFLVFTVIFSLVMIGALFGWSKLEYKFYKYGMNENGFQKEYGVIAKKYVTIPYERVQNIDMSQTLVERIIGLYDINIQTAGMSSGMGRFGARMAEGMLPGISKKEAENLRDELIKRSRKKGGGGV